jgi:ketosteroid isomerase-like protein
VKLGKVMKNRDVVAELYRCLQKKEIKCFQRYCSPSIIWQQNSGFPGEGTYQGPEAVVDKVFKAFNNEWKHWSFEIERIIDTGDDIVVLGHFSGYMRDDNTKFKKKAASHIYSFDAGKVVKFQQFTNN